MEGGRRHCDTDQRSARRRCLVFRSEIPDLLWRRPSAYAMRCVPKYHISLWVIDPCFAPSLFSHKKFKNIMAIISLVLYASLCNCVIRLKLQKTYLYFSRFQVWRVPFKTRRARISPTMAECFEEGKKWSRRPSRKVGELCLAGLDR